MPRKKAREKFSTGVGGIHSGWIVGGILEWKRGSV